MTWFLELHGHVPVYPIAPFQSALAANLELDASTRIALGGDFSLLVGVGTALNDGYGDTHLRGLLSLAWAPRAHDRDGDGIPDDLDQCPDLPEDKDGFEDEDGCPEMDNDDDGIPDSLDRCPNEKGSEEREGCPDPDKEKGGVPHSPDSDGGTMPSGSSQTTGATGGPPQAKPR
jgi:hypothetical protein